MRKVYLFSDVCDVFIENEIPYLSKYFDSVVIVPFWKVSFSKKFVLPPNCELLPPICTSKTSLIVKGCWVLGTIPLFLKEFLDNKLWQRTNEIKRFLLSCLTVNFFIKSQSIKKIKQDVALGDIFYSYWGVGAAEWFPFIEHLDVKKVVRLHRGDLYEERGYLPFRKNIFASIDLAVFISINGEQYLKKRYVALNNKSIVSRLGTFDHGLFPKRSGSGVFHVLSCSYVHSVKRVHLIFEALQQEHDRVIHWTHIGGGEDFDILKTQIQNANSNLRISLLGNLSNDEVIEFYKTNYISVFLNVSASEGIPVSIMEAISFNIPIVATDVGGTSEIVTNETGILLSPNPTIAEILNALYSIDLQETHPREFWQKNFNADSNYNKFMKILVSL